MTDKQREFCGDALFTFLARDYYCNKKHATERFDHSKINVIVGRMCANGIMGRIAVGLGIITQWDAHSARKGGGDEFEIFIYKMFQEHGISHCQEWFANEVIPYFETHLLNRIISQSQLI